MYLNARGGKWDTSEWIKFGTVVLTVSGLFVLDEDIREFALNRRTESSKQLAFIVEPLGNEAPLFVGIAIGLAGTVNKNWTTAGRLGLNMLESNLISAGIYTQIIKISLGRHRPYKNDGAHNFEGFSPYNVGNKSFPSGHSCTAFSWAVIVADEFKDSKIITALAYSTATLTAISRVHDDKHWASDIFFGSLLGYYCGRKIIQQHDERKRGSSYSINLNYTGLEFTKSF